MEKFLGWFDLQITSANTHNLLNYRDKAPYSIENHPTDEHLLPFYVAMGAAGEKSKAVKLHASYDLDFLAMDAWEFSPAK